MSPPKKVDVDPEEQQMLREWRELVEEHYIEDIQHLKGHPDILCGFEVMHAHLDEKETLRLQFHIDPTRTLELGTRIMREQFEHHDVHMRPVIRVVSFPENYLRRVDDLRMRDRNRVVALDVKIIDVSQPYGWLKLAVYECRRCGTPAHLPQRRARERDRPKYCEPCFEELLESAQKGERDPREFLPPTFRMVTEECTYEDVQDLRMCQVTYNSDHHVLNTSTKHPILGTVTDDLVGEVMQSGYARVNGIVRVQPIPERTFARDTRRLLSIDVLSVEPLPLDD